MAKHKKGPKQQGGGGKRSGSRLANALAHSRAQEAHLQKLKHSRSVREQQEQARKTNAGGGKAKGKGKAAEDTQVRRRCMIEKGERVLLVGEGNFSFAASLIAHHGVPGHLLTATCYDSSSTLHSKYPDVDSHLSVLEAAGAEVLYDVDAGSLDTDKRTRKRKWDRVAWLFPHVGKGIKDEERNVRANQIELMRFLRAVKGVLEEGKPGEPLPEDEGMSDPDDDDEEVEEDLQRPRSRPGRVCITLRNSHPYTLWDVPALAKRGPQLAPSILHPAHPALRSLAQPAYTLLRSFRFDPALYPGYAHRRTVGWREGLSTEGCEDLRLPAKERGKGAGEGGGAGDARTWEFEVRASKEVDD